MVESMTPAAALVEAVRLAEGQSALARIVGVTPGAIWQRIDAEKPAAETWVLKIEKATGISRHDLRPDIYPRSEVPVGPSTDSLQPDMAAAR